MNTLNPLQRRIKALQNHNELVVNVSARHCHLKQEHIDILFGIGYRLTKMRQLYQPTDYAAYEQITLVGPKGEIERLRILGPARSYSQVELAQTDARRIGLDPPIRQSGQLEATPGCMLIGPQGQVVITKGVIIAERHVHMNFYDAAYLGVDDHDMMDLHIDGLRPAVLERVVVRVKADWRLEVHIDTDEANCCDLVHATSMWISKPIEFHMNSRRCS